MGAGMRDSRWLIPAAILVVLQYASALSLSYAIGFGERPPISNYMLIAFVLSAVGGLAIGLRWLWSLWRANEQNPTQRLMRETDYAAVAAYVIGFQLVALQMGALTWLKHMLPLVVPYWADPALAQLDRTFLGVDAWRIVPESLIRPLDVAYANWGPVKTVVLLLMLSLPPSGMKSRAMLAFFLTVGLLGVSGQYLLSSAGPIFYAQLGFGDQYVPMLARLDEHAPIARAASSYLWQAYIANDATIGSGISAMPSMHVAMTTWATLALAAAWPRTRLPMWSFAVVVFVGSFALGWHYVSDGVAGALGAILCWKLAAVYLECWTTHKRRLVANTI